MGFSKPITEIGTGACSVCGEILELREGYCTACAPLDVVARAIQEELAPDCELTIEKKDVPFQIEGMQGLGLEVSLVGPHTEDQKRAVMDALVQIMAAQNCPCETCVERRKKRADA